MKHYILEHGDILDSADGGAVAELVGTLTGVAHNNSRTLFCFADGGESFTLHLDKDQRPASRLLQLLSGAIAFNLRTAVLNIHSEKSSTAGQSRLRLKVEDSLIPAPERMPEFEERVANNAVYLDAINAALGVVAQVEQEAEDGASIVGSCDGGLVSENDSLCDDDAGVVVVRRIERPRGRRTRTESIIDSLDEERDEFHTVFERYSNARRRGDAGSEQIPTMVDILVRQAQAYEKAAKNLRESLHLCLSAVGYHVDFEGGRIQINSDGQVYLNADNTTKPLAPSLKPDTDTIRHAILRGFSDLDEC